MSNPDFVTLAKSMKVHAIRCDNAADLPAKMKEFMEYDNSRPVLLDACIIEVCRKQIVGSSLLISSFPTDGDRLSASSSRKSAPRHGHAQESGQSRVLVGYFCGLRLRLLASQKSLDLAHD